MAITVRSMGFLKAFKEDADSCKEHWVPDFPEEDDKCEEHGVPGSVTKCVHHKNEKEMT